MRDCQPRLPLNQASGGPNGELHHRAGGSVAVSDYEDGAGRGLLKRGVNESALVEEV